MRLKREFKNLKKNTKLSIIYISYDFNWLKTSELKTKI